MATKLTSPKTATKDTGASRSTAKAPARAKTGDDKQKAKAAPAAKAEKPRQPKLKEIEVVDLLEPKKKPRSSTPAPKKLLPRIGKIVPPGAKAEADSAAPAPVAEPVAAAPAEVPAPEKEEAPVSDAKVIHVKPPIIVKELAALMGLKPYQLISDLMEMNIFASINQTLESDVAAKVCEKHGFIFEKEKRKSGEGVHKQEKIVEPPPPPPEVLEKKPKEKFVQRPPIITFMGHVDHGKTSLMDYIRKSRVAAGEAGGITQHIGAYSVQHNGSYITFIDTPGHAAFTAMRARGANVTDIVVIVVAADDGVMPQTIEAINHAKAAGVTIMVAINKIDLPTANVDRVKLQLQEHGLTPEDWGGETICCPVSATKGTGVDHLLEMMQLQAEVLELKSDPSVEPRCTVIEAQSEQGRGSTATVIVRMGTLKVGQAFICGNQWGKVKMLINDLGKPVKEAGPGMPVKILGFMGMPNAGDELVVMPSEKAARALSEERIEEERKKKLSAPVRPTLESLFSTIAENQRKTLRVVIKADAQGSMEAIVASLKEINSKKIDLEIIHSAVGPISESDVLLASASEAIVVGFNVKTENNAITAAKREGIQIKLYSIIYELIDQVKEAMTGLLDPELRETVLGHAEVKQIFKLAKGTVAGCMVTDGRISRAARARLLRNRQPVYDGGIATLKRFQDEVKEVRNGLECGIKLGDYSEYEVGDIIECYQLEKVPQSL